MYTSQLILYITGQSSSGRFTLCKLPEVPSKTTGV